MPHVLRFTEDAQEALNQLVKGGRATEAKLKKVRKALAFLQQDPRYPGLNSHEYENFPGRTHDKVWDSYVENHVPSAWRVYWMYGPDETVDGQELAVITVLAIRPHL